MSLIIRNAKAGDGPSLVEIERQCFSNPSWDGDAFLRYSCTVAEIDGRVIGFLVSRETFPAIGTAPAEREILNLGVTAQCRRMGIATALLQHELNQLATHFLEVRQSNVAAQALYRKHGFVEVGRRFNYYQSPKETAIVMRLKRW